MEVKKSFLRVVSCGSDHIDCFASLMDAGLDSYRSFVPEHSSKVVSPPLLSARNNSVDFSAVGMSCCFPGGASNSSEYWRSFFVTAAKLHLTFLLIDGMRSVLLPTPTSTKKRRCRCCMDHLWMTWSVSIHQCLAFPRPRLYQCLPPRGYF